MRRSYGKALFKKSNHRGQLPHLQGRQQGSPWISIWRVQEPTVGGLNCVTITTEHFSVYFHSSFDKVMLRACVCDNCTKLNCWVSTKFHGARRPRKIRKFCHENMCIPVCWYLNKNMWVVNYDAAMKQWCRCGEHHLYLASPHCLVTFTKNALDV